MSDTEDVQQQQPVEQKHFEEIPTVEREEEAPVLPVEENDSQEEELQESYDTEPSAVQAEENEETHEPVVLQESDVDHFSPLVEENILEYEQDHLETEAEELVREPTPEPPVYVTETTVRRESVSSPNENNNPEMFKSPKKLGGGVWPPQDESFQKVGGIPEDTGVGKKRVSDLIARFNAGNVENDGLSKTDSAYKQAYGASGRNGKVQQSVFH